MLQRAGDYLRLVAADEDGIGAYEAGILERLRQGDEHVAGDGVDKIAALIHKAALKHAEKIENGQLFNMAAVYRLHIVGGDIPGGEHTVKRAVVVDDGHGGNLPLAHRPPREIHRHGAVQLRRAVKVEIAHLRAHAFHILGRLKAEVIEHMLGLVV